MSEAKPKRDGLPEQSVVMRLTEGAVPENPARYADIEILESALNEAWIEADGDVIAMIFCTWMQQKIESLKKAQVTDGQ